MPHEVACAPLVPPQAEYQQWQEAMQTPRTVLRMEQHMDAGEQHMEQHMDAGEQHMEQHMDAGEQHCRRAPHTLDAPVVALASVGEHSQHAGARAVAKQRRHGVVAQPGAQRVYVITTQVPQSLLTLWEACGWPGGWGGGQTGCYSAACQNHKLQQAAGALPRRP
jgi:hypothetical protein